MVKNTVPEVCQDCGGLTKLIKHKFRCSEDFDCDALLETNPDEEWLEENAWLYDEDEDKEVYEAVNLPIGKALIAVKRDEQNDCKVCAFSYYCAVFNYPEDNIRCSEQYRDDKTSVIYKLVDYNPKGKTK